jgi:hypothetical protein
MILDAYNLFVSEKTTILFRENGLAFGAFRLLTDILVPQFFASEAVRML